MAPAFGTGARFVDGDTPSTWRRLYATGTSGGKYLRRGRVAAPVWSVDQWWAAGEYSGTGYVLRSGNEAAVSRW